MILSTLTLLCALVCSSINRSPLLVWHPLHRVVTEIKLVNTKWLEKCMCLLLLLLSRCHRYIFLPPPFPVFFPLLLLNREIWIILVPEFIICTYWCLCNSHPNQIPQNLSSLAPLDYIFINWFKSSWYKIMPILFPNKFLCAYLLKKKCPVSCFWYRRYSQNKIPSIHIH